MNDEQFNNAIQEATSKIIKARCQAIEQFLRFHNANPETHELANYFETDTFVLLPKGLHPPIEEALKYPHLTFKMEIKTS